MRNVHSLIPLALGLGLEVWEAFPSAAFWVLCVWRKGNLFLSLGDVPVIGFGFNCCAALTMRDGGLWRRNGTERNEICENFCSSTARDKTRLNGLFLCEMIKREAFLSLTPG